ncbi:MAG: ABC transporter ATP-binding protein [Halobacteriales archaeon]
MSGLESPLLSVESIDTYYGSSHVLHGVSLAVEAGEIVTLIGRNGAGKTTTLRSITGLTPPQSGTIRFRGSEIQGHQPYQIRRSGITWVPEDRRIFPSLTVDDNLRIAGNAGPAGSDTDRVYDLFPRLDERRSQSAGTLSGGEQQMLAIARALVGPETDLLLLDEPSEGLAPQIIEDVRQIIREINDDGVTILLVEQNADLALELAERAYVIETGRIQYEGPAEKLREDAGLMQKYLGVG